MEQDHSMILGQEAASVFIRETYSEEWDYTAQTAYIELSNGSVFEVPNEELPITFVALEDSWTVFQDNEQCAGKTIEAVLGASSPVYALLDTSNNSIFKPS